MSDTIPIDTEDTRPSVLTIWEDEDRTQAMDLTGLTVRCQARTSRGSDEGQVVSSTVTNAAGGQIALSLFELAQDNEWQLAIRLTDSGGVHQVIPNGEDPIRVRTFAKVDFPE